MWWAEGAGLEPEPACADRLFLTQPSHPGTSTLRREATVRGARGSDRSASAVGAELAQSQRSRPSLPARLTTLYDDPASGATTPEVGMSEKMWGSEPYWGLGYEWDPD